MQEKIKIAKEFPISQKLKTLGFIELVESAVDNESKIKTAKYEKWSNE